MRIDTTQLLRAVPNTDKTRAKEFVAVFNEWADKFGINTTARVVHFLSQVFHESGCLHYTEEIASGKAYEGRKDLGNTQPGDGVKYKGRGFIQITGRSNYKAYATSGFCVGDLMSHPEWLSQSPGHTKSAMWFWWKNSLNTLADRDKNLRQMDGEAIVTKITTRVNGGTNGLAARKYYYRRFRSVFGLK